MSEWPEPVREPDEPPRWLGWGVWALLLGALVWASSGENARWRMPDFALPEITLPQIRPPAFELPDFGANDNAQTRDAAAPEAFESMPGAPPGVDFNVPLVEGVAFEDCVSAIEDAATVMGTPGVLEDSADRRVARFKTREGDMTFTCDRVDQTMRVERRGG